MTREVPEPTPPTPFQVVGGWAAPDETGDDPYVSEGEARRAGRDVLAQLYKQQGRI